MEQALLALAGRNSARVPGRAAPAPHALSALLALRPLVSNQGMRMLLEAPASVEPEDGVCHCGGRCSKCAHSAPPEEPDKEHLTGPSTDVPDFTATPAPDDNGPHADSGTIVCDGTGGYKVSYGWGDTAPCGVKDCVRQHEESHIADWMTRWPNGCKGADGKPKPSGTAVPTGGDGYGEFLRNSECKAYKIELACEQNLRKGASKACEPYLDGVIKDREKQVSANCASGC